MSLVTRRARAARLERWAEAAMRELMHGRKDRDIPEVIKVIAWGAWQFALEMENERMKVIEALRGVDVEEP